MDMEILAVILLPFLGTTIGAAFVFFLKGQMNRTLQRSLTGFASGVMVAASVTEIKLTATIRVFGTDAPVPELVLPAYRSGKVTNVSDEEFAALLGRPLPADTAEGKLTVLDTVSQFYRAKGMVARWLGKCVERSIQRSRAKGDPAPNALFAYNLPIRGFCQMTQGKITRKMTQDIVHMVNGHFLTGLCRFAVHFVTGRIQTAKFWKSIREPLK